MALIVEYHVVADMYPVSSTSITAGMAVSLNSAGQAIPSATGTKGPAVMGIAGDSSLTSEGQTTAYSAQVVIGADGAGTRWTENRVSDFYDETVASQKITIYNGGGKFWISENLFDDVTTDGTVGTYLQPSAATVAGEWDATSTIQEAALIVFADNSAYDSGVPGTDTTDGSMTLGNYVGVVCRI
jgi:hypothetical protein